MASNYRQFYNSNVSKNRPAQNRPTNAAVLSQILDRLTKLEVSAARPSHNSTSSVVRSRSVHQPSDRSAAPQPEVGRPTGRQRQGPYRPTQRTAAPEDRNANRQQSPPNYGNGSSTPFVQSNNPDFRALVKSMTQLGQVDQHCRNWERPPPSIAQNVKKIIETIRPPRPSEYTTARLEVAGEAFLADVQSIVQDHLQSTRLDILDEFGQLDHTDHALAGTIVVRQLSKRLGKRLHMPTLTSSLHGIEPEVRSTRPVRAPVSTGNRFDALSLIVETDNGPLSTSSSTSNSPSAAKRAKPDVGSHRRVNVSVTSEQRRQLHHAMARMGPITAEDQQTIDVISRSTSALDLAVVAQPRFVAHSSRHLQSPSHAIPPPASVGTSTNAPSTAGVVPAVSSASAAAAVPAASVSSPLPVTAAVATVVSAAPDAEADAAAADAAVSVSSILPLSNVGLHRAAQRKQWRVNAPFPYHSVQIIGDSNLSSFRDFGLPKDFNIDSFSGAHIQDLVDVLKRCTTWFSYIKTVVFSAGINDRDTDPDLIWTSLLELLEWKESTGVQLVFLSVPIFAHLSQEQKNNIDVINSQARDLFKDSFLTCCTNKQVIPSSMDKGGIHYNSDTAEAIVNNLCTFLKFN